MANKTYEPTAKDRQVVLGMARGGLPQDDIATAMGLSSKTLRKHFRDELDRGAIQATAIVTERLFAMTKTNVAAAIFWMKARAGWTERFVVDSKTELTGKDGGALAVKVYIPDNGRGDGPPAAAPK